jgi:hypothetical protein
MSDPVTNLHSQPSGNGKRWYDPGKMVVTLFMIVGFFIVSWSGFVFTVAYGAGQKNLQQDEQIKAISDRLGNFDVRFDKQDGKLDRILERMPK